MTESRNSCLWCASGSQKNICLDEAITPFIKIDNTPRPLMCLHQRAGGTIDSSLTERKRKRTKTLHRHGILGMWQHADFFKFQIGYHVHHAPVDAHHRIIHQKILVGHVVHKRTGLEPEIHMFGVSEKAVIVVVYLVVVITISRVIIVHICFVQIRVALAIDGGRDIDTTHVIFVLRAHAGHHVFVTVHAVISIAVHIGVQAGDTVNENVVGD